MISTDAHEFNHVIRFQKINAEESSTVLGSLALEGLAQCFVEDMTGDLRPWSKALDREHAMEVWEKIKEKLDVSSMDFYNRLFLKKDDPEFRHRSGYALSYLVVKTRIIGLGGKPDWEDLTGMPSATLISKGMS